MKNDGGRMAEVTGTEASEKIKKTEALFFHRHYL